MRQLEGLLDKAGRARMTASTAMNEHSSRSHALFMLDIGATHSDGVTYLRGGLRLCDLAGSERLDRTGTASDATRLKETVNINKSLSCLADVFVSLGNKAPHIPYRNSKLTMVLQDCLSGDGKALMFVNVSPTSNSSQETLCSLRFASQVGDCIAAGDFFRFSWSEFDINCRNNNSILIFSIRYRLIKSSSARPTNASTRSPSSCNRNCNLSLWHLSRRLLSLLAGSLRVGPSG
jgi:Kinesin motor domain